MALNEGGAAALLGGGDAGGGDGGGAGDGGAAAAGAASGGAQGGAGGGVGDPEWLGQFSAEGADADNPSNRDWLKAKGFKSIDDVAKSYREAEKGLRDGGRIKVPGEGAKAEELAAYRKAIGVPDKVEGYEIDKPEGLADDDINGGLVEKLRGAALEAGVPAAAFKRLSGELIKAQLDDVNAYKAAEDQKAADVVKEWGAQKDARLAEVNGAMRALDLKQEDVAAIQRGFGSDRTLKLLQKLGAGMAEDALLGGEKRKFGITGPEAQAELNKLSADPDFGRKLYANDPEAKSRWERLNAAVAASRDAQERAAGQQ